MLIEVQLLKLTPIPKLPDLTVPTLYILYVESRELNILFLYIYSLGSLSL